MSVRRAATGNVRQVAFDVAARVDDAGFLRLHAADDCAVEAAGAGARTHKSGGLGASDASCANLVTDYVCSVLFVCVSALRLAAACGAQKWPSSCAREQLRTTARGASALVGAELPVGTSSRDT